MPIHDWPRVSAGTFHDLHVGWIAEIRRSLNGGLLPEGYYALAEQVARTFGSDMHTLQLPDDDAAGTKGTFRDSGGGAATLAMPPKLAVTDTLKLPMTPAPPQRRITIRHNSDDRIIAFLEIVAPANKDRTGSVERLSQRFDRSPGTSGVMSHR